MGPIEHPHHHQMLEDWILPINVRPISSLFFVDADHVPPQDIIVGETFQGVIMPMTLLKTFGPHYNNTMTHSLIDLDPLGQQHQRADDKVGRTT